MPYNHKPSVVIVGAGEFGAATACSLLKSGRYGTVTVLDRAQTLPAMDAASCDINKVVRYDYADPMYAELAREAITEWSKPEWKGIYYQSGVVVRGMEVPGHHGQSMLDTYNNVRKGNPTVKLLETPGAFVEKLAPTPGIHARKPKAHVRGYYNGWGGWANASKAVQKLYADLRNLGGKLVPGAELATLIYTEDGSDVVGIKCVDGREFRRDKVVLALGSWTPSHPAVAGMMPEGLITATGQTVAAIQLSPEDHKRYANIPVSMHHDGSSYYSFPPNENGLLKFALHGAGYLSETGVPRTAADQGASAWTEANARGWIPSESLKKLREQLDIIYPELAAMPVAFTRMCWYSDVVDGDWVIDYSPKHPSLLFATGGAGHAFKFLPIIGDLIVSRLEGRLHPTYARRWRVTRTPTAVDPARVGLQRKPLNIEDLVTRTEMLVPGDAPIAHL